LFVKGKEIKMIPDVIVCGPATILGGVTNCGGGWAIIGGKLVKIPPRSPSLKKIFAAYQILNHADGVDGSKPIRDAAEKMLVSAVQEFKK
jgi:hypothetical protein